MPSDIWQETLKLDDTTPLYRQLEQILLRHIKANDLKPGDGIPSEGEFCTHYGLSRSTVRQAFKQLEEQGLVVRRRGLGTFIAEPKVSRNLGYLYSFTSQLTDMGYTATSRVLQFEDTVLDKETAKLLKLPKGLPVYIIERLRLANDVPMLLEHTTIIKRFCPPLTARSIETHSLYQMLKQNGLSICSAVESYEPVVMSKKTQKLLACENDACAFHISRKSYTESGELFEYTRSVMPGQRSKLELTLLEDGISVNRYEEKG